MTRRSIPRYKRKKALLIGVSYKTNNAQTTLAGPHQDVKELKKALIDLYGYTEESIVVMLDDGKSDELEPTRENILREVKNLVADAQPGDHFLFHFAGHGEQVLSKSNSEEDGYDEVLVPSDGMTQGSQCERGIVDNELRRHLVDPLPAECSLVAIFDTCHSGTMLDLDHNRCNRVWKSSVSIEPGRADTKVMKMVALHYREMSPKSISWHAKQKAMLWRKTSATGPSRSSTRQRSSKTKTFPANLYPLEIPSYHPSPTAHLHDSPVSICPGFCHTLPIRKRAHVISLSSCKDSQISSDASSLTMGLVGILRNNTFPTLKEMMTDLCYYVHTALTPVVEHLSDCQDPQLASLEPLNMETVFTL